MTSRVASVSIRTTAALGHTCDNLDCVRFKAPLISHANNFKSPGLTV
jgi:hypothetical protein